MADPIEISDLTVGYNGRPVLRNIDLTLKPDDFLAVIGPNGGGKTTLFRAILGLLTPMNGTVKVLGERPETGVKNVGYVPQFGTFDRSFPILAEEVVLMGLRVHKGLRPFYSKEEKEMAEAAMEYAEMENFRHKKIGDLSGGQLQRVFLARALAPHPKVLLLDEPTASLDPSMKDCTYDILRKANLEGVAVMLITHDMTGLSHDVKRLACVNGRIIVSDRPEITEEMVELGFHCPPEFLRFSARDTHDHTCCGKTVL
ncbi:MAG: ABC transporter ATP-binding protein [Methanomethylophilus sp.]|nr:ABC transporter ATP-binding protein [Methanomethylophilus sp.]MDD4668322.1 ABC transporter ATP-binding protein [Methanomethylophilus sp.]